MLVARAALDDIDARRWTLDIDGSVLTTGLEVGAYRAWLQLRVDGAEAAEGGRPRGR